MKFLTKGLFALTLILIFQTQLVAEYLYKDEIVHRPNFTLEVNDLGAELYQKTGIRLLLVMLRELPHGQNLKEYEKSILDSFKEPTILLLFSEMDQLVDIEVNDNSLYKYFNKNRVLSPNASALDAFIVAVIYADSFERFNTLRKDYGGSILPLIATKAKDEQIVGKYAASMYNGYLDIAQQISKAKGIKLENDPGTPNQTSIFFVKLFFYSFVLYAIIMFIKRTFYRIRHKNE